MYLPSNRAKDYYGKNDPDTSVTYLKPSELRVAIS